MPMARPMTVAMTASSSVTGSADEGHVPDRLPGVLGDTQVARREVGQPAQELADQWLVDAVVVTQRCQLGRGQIACLGAQRRRDLVSGHDAEGDEDQDRDTEQGQPDLDETTRRCGAPCASS